MSHRNSLDGYEKYVRALSTCPKSAELATKIFEYCRDNHKFEGEPTKLCWPTGQSGWIVSEPNYFTFQTINTRTEAVVIDLNPTDWKQFVCPNGVTEKEAERVELKGRGNDQRAQMTIRSADVLPIAFKVLDFAHRCVIERLAAR